MSPHTPKQSSSLDPLARKFGYQDYDHYTNSQHWKDFKQQYRRSSLPQWCLVCRKAGYQLHHLHYDNFNAEKLEDVIPLCKVHHKEVHTWLRKNGLSAKASLRAVEALKVPLPAATPSLEVATSPRSSQSFWCPACHCVTTKGSRSPRCGDCRITLLPCWLPAGKGFHWNPRVPPMPSEGSS